jgi:hypothetical protein
MLNRGPNGGNTCLWTMAMQTLNRPPWRPDAVQENLFWRRESMARGRQNCFFGCFNSRLLLSAKIKNSGTCRGALFVTPRSW